MSDNDKKQLYSLFVLMTSILNLAKNSVATYNLMNSILSIARTKDDPEKINISEIMQTSLALIRKKIQHLGITIEERLEADPVIHIIPQHLNQVLLNLLTNAADALQLCDHQKKIEVITRIDQQNKLIIEIKMLGNR